jgi:CheY-like chemotaxis protein
MKHSLRILLVDDDEDDRQFFCEAAQEVDSAIKCNTAKDGLAAIDFLNKQEVLPDFIFLDLNMPRMDGRQCLKALKELPAYSNIPVIIYSTSMLDHDLESTVRLGASFFIKKPVLFEDLCKEIFNVVKGVLHYGKLNISQ